MRLSINNRQKQPGIDARVKQTRDALGDALIELIQKRPFDSLTVQDVLDRAGVGRSTFYVHYSSMDDLFMSDVAEFLENFAMALPKKREPSMRLFPVREFFAHIKDGAELYRALIASGKINDFMELAQGHVARGIKQRMRQVGHQKGATSRDQELTAHSLASMLLGMLTWWLDHGCKETPEQLEKTFHKQAWRGLGLTAAR